MIQLNLNLEGDGALPGVEIIEITTPLDLLVLPKGTVSGRPSVSLHFEHDGKHYVAQTSAKLLCLAGQMIAARYPDVFED